MQVQIFNKVYDSNSIQTISIKRAIRSVYLNQLYYITVKANGISEEFGKFKCENKTTLIKLLKHIKKKVNSPAFVFNQHCTELINITKAQKVELVHIKEQNAYALKITQQSGVVTYSKMSSKLKDFDKCLKEYSKNTLSKEKQNER